MEKIKDLNKYIKGQIDIEVLNEKGEVISKTTDYNNLTDRSIWFMLFNCLLRNHSINYGSNLLKDSHNIFSNLFLVNTEQGSVKSDYIDGEIVGFCNLTEIRASSNPKEGVIIQDTPFNKGTYKFEVEFGLDKAVGTFNTIMLGSRDVFNNRNLEVTENGYFGTPQTLEGITGNIDSGVYVFIKSLLYVLNNGYYTVYNVNRNSNGELFFNKIKTEDFNTNGLEPSTACYNPVDNKMYIQSNKTTLIYNGDTVELEDTKEDMFKDIISYYNGNLVGRHIDWYYFDAIARTLVIRDTDFNLIENKEITNNREYIEGIHNTFNGEFLYITFRKLNNPGTNLQVYAGNNKIIDNMLDDYVFEFGIATPLFDKNTTISFNREQGNKLMKCFLAPSTISKLVQPVTKTYNQTLRVGYTFYINY